LLLKKIKNISGCITAANSFIILGDIRYVYMVFYAVLSCNVIYWDEFLNVAKVQRLKKKVDNFCFFYSSLRDEIFKKYFR
jgi:hypothetical protein